MELSVHLVSTSGSISDAATKPLTNSSTATVIVVLLLVICAVIVLCAVKYRTDHRDGHTKLKSIPEPNTHDDNEDSEGGDRGERTELIYMKTGTSELSHVVPIGKRHSVLVKPVKRVDNALVIFFGIAMYQHETYPDLEDINEDELYFRDTFEDKFRYRFIANEYNKHWNKSDVENWIVSIRNSVLIVNDCMQYNALIFCGASHGSTYAMICSDGKKLNLKDIRSLFAWNVNNQFRNLPKMFIFNCCRTQYETPRGAHQDTVAAGYSVSITGTEGDPVFGSKLSRYVADAFNECSKDKKKANAGDILRAATRKAREEGDMQLRLQEHDMEIDDVVFVKHPQSRGSKAKRISKDTRQRSLENDLRRFLKD
eukprot:996869_1